MPLKAGLSRPLASLAVVWSMGLGSVTRGDPCRNLKSVIEAKGTVRPEPDSRGPNLAAPNDAASGVHIKDIAAAIAGSPEGVGGAAALDRRDIAIALIAHTPLGLSA